MLRDAVPDVPMRKLQVALKMLVDAGLVEKAGKMLHLLPADDLHSHAAQAAQQYTEREERDREILGAMVAYARSGQCRWRLLLEYFADTPEWERCNHCDSCRHARDAEMLEHQLQEKTVGMPKSEPLPGFTVGDRVAVRRRGAGVVEAVTRERVDIRFPDGSLRRFLPHYVRRLKHQPGPPPQEQAA